MLKFRACGIFTNVCQLRKSASAKVAAKYRSVKKMLRIFNRACINGQRAFQFMAIVLQLGRQLKLAIRHNSN
jgi:hypothetical protein